jgi:hypothetical protein
MRSRDKLLLIAELPEDAAELVTSSSYTTAECDEVLKVHSTNTDIAFCKSMKRSQLLQDIVGVERVSGRFTRRRGTIAHGHNPERGGDSLPPDSTNASTPSRDGSLTRFSDLPSKGKQ